jgi:hypothetical protein
MKNVLIALALVLFVGCANPPEYYSIDPAFSPAEAEVIRDAVAARCDATDYCPTEAAVTDRGAINLVDHIKNTGADHCPKGHTCIVAGHNDGDSMRIARDRPGSLDELWLTVAHEMGHYCSGHTKRGLMAAVHEEDSEPLIIDQTAINAWFDGCGH